MYKPDRVFMRELKLLDNRLGVKFNGSNFVITYDRGHGDPVNIHCVKTDDGGFRQPDKRDIDFVASGDLSRDSVRYKLQGVSKYFADFQEKERRKRKELIRDLTKDGKYQLRNAVDRVNNEGKRNSTFRRINLKPKGVSF